MAKVIIPTPLRKFTDNQASFETNSENVLCPDEKNGEISVAAMGGTEPYTYEWSNTQTANPIANVVVGAYTVTLTDAQGCTAADTGEVLPVPNADITETNPEIIIIKSIINYAYCTFAKWTQS